MRDLPAEATPAAPPTGYRREFVDSADGVLKVRKPDGTVVDLEGGGGAHPDLAAHDLLGLATQAELDAHAASPHNVHPDLAAHDLLGLATQAELDAHAGLTTSAHGGLVASTDPRLSDARVPTGPAGGVLGGTYPNPDFAVDMATQAELDAVNAAAAHLAGAETLTGLKTLLGGFILPTGAGIGKFLGSDASGNALWRDGGMELLAEHAVTAATQTGWTWGSVPQTHRHLFFVMSGASTTSGLGSDRVTLKLNNDTTTAMSRHVIDSGDASIGAALGTSAGSIPVGIFSRAGVGFWGAVVGWIPDYGGGQTKHLLSFSHCREAVAGWEVHMQLWNTTFPTGAITRIDVLPGTGSFGIGSRFCFYGIQRIA